MEVPDTRCKDGSVQARQDIQRLRKKIHPYILFCTWHNSSGYSLRLMGNTIVQLKGRNGLLA